MILEILLSILLLTGILLILFDQVIPGVCLIIGSVVITAYLIYKYVTNEKSLSSRILNITSQKPNKRLFDRLCDRLFNKQGQQTYRQYRDMKINRSEYESDNLCKNLAKVKSRQK